MATTQSKVTAPPNAFGPMVKVVRRPPARLKSMTVGGFKSIVEPTTLALGDITVLAGANSSGKSSFIQPFLLLKQTLESTYDPDGLVLNGANVRFTSSAQFLSKIGTKKVDEMIVCWESEDSSSVHLRFRKSSASGPMNIYEQSDSIGPSRRFTINRDMSSDEVAEEILRSGLLSEDSSESWRLRRIVRAGQRRPLRYTEEEQLRRDDLVRSANWSISRSRIFLRLELSRDQRMVMEDEYLLLLSEPLGLPNRSLSAQIERLIHLPGLRGNPERTYRTAMVGERFSGTFPDYAASVIAQWQSRKSPQLQLLFNDLIALGLTWKVEAKPVDETQVELKVGRVPRRPKGGRSDDVVSIADVGVGVSQTLPLLVALNCATYGQIVYVEQPEIHLHPRAQQALAGVLASAAKRGVQVIVETHSSILILALQTLVAEKALAPQAVRLHWFSRDEDGVTSVETADMDETGAFGDWPSDFDDVMLDAQDAYLNAAHARLAARQA